MRTLIQSTFSVCRISKQSTIQNNNTNKSNVIRYIKQNVLIAHKNTAFYIGIVGLFVFLKYCYAFAETEDVLFLLTPTNYLVELLTGVFSIFIQEHGYFYQQLDVLIDKSCSGFDFMLLCYFIINYLIIKNLESNIRKIISIPFSLISAYVFTIFVNSSRIYSSIQIKDLEVPFISQSILHDLIGIIVNLIFLILLYFLVEHTFKFLKTNEKSI